MAKEEKIKDEMEQIEKKEHDEEDENEEEDIDENQTENENKDDDNSDFEDYSLEKKRDNLKDGDYIVQVHIIEGRELKGRGWNAMSDPVISVECMNQKQSTEIKKNCINAIWDTVLFFEFKNLDGQQINEGKCIISAFDANNFTRNVLIGLYEFDLSTIYFNNKYHEIYKKWIGLYDITDEFDGIQGYLRVSIVVLGPNDEQKTHKLIDEDEDETNLLSVLLPPSITQIPYLLSISIYEYIKPLKFKNKITTPFILIEFVGCKIKSKIRVNTTDNNPDDIVCDILYQFQIPVMEPILSQSIKISFFNYNRTKQNDKIASLIIDYKLLKNKLSLYDKPRLYSLYGAPFNHQNNKKIAKKMNNGFIDGSTFRGQCLLSLNLTKQNQRPKKGIVDIGITNDLRPKMRLYLIKFDLYEASEIYLAKNKSVYIEFNIGNFYAKSRKVKVKDGRCEWYQCIVSNDDDNDNNNNNNNINNNNSNDNDDNDNENTLLLPLKQIKYKKNKNNNKYRNNIDGHIGPISLPIDIDQCPDIIIYLCSSSNNKRISYLRMSFKSIFDQKWRNTPKWYHLMEDKVIDALNDNIFPGSLLFALNAGTTDNMPIDGYLIESRPFIQGDVSTFDDRNRDKSITDNNDNNNKQSIGTLTVYIQQAQNLPAMDKSGKSDPYVKLKINDNRGNILSGKTSTIPNTLNPKWYQSFTFNNIPIDETLKIEIFDSDKLRRDDLMGFVEILLITQSNRGPAINFDVKNWFLINQKHPDSKLQCRIKFDFNNDNLNNNKRKLVNDNTINCIFGQPQKVSMQLRANLFMARNLSATDSNGLCDPYVVIMCCGQIQKSKIMNKTIDPQWFQTLILNVLLPKPIIYAPDIHILIKDYDKFSKDDVVGRFMIKPSDISGNNELPIWYKLCDADNNPLQNGQVLMSFSLINVSYSKMPILSSLKPKTSEKWLQIIILGLRDLKSMFGINKPYLKFYINNKQFKTKKSNKPSKVNPNFLQILKIKLPFPDNYLFAPNLRIAIKDSLFGGTIKRTIGNASISLQHLLINDQNDDGDDNDIDDNKDEKDDKYDKDDNDDYKIEEKLQAIKEKTTLNKMNTSSTLKTQETDIVIDVNTDDNDDDDDDDIDDIELKPLINDLDDENDKKESSDSEEEESFDLDLEQKVDTSEDIADYMIDRRIIDNELEDEINCSPFLEIPLFRGQINSKLNKQQKIGYFKGLIELSDKKNSDSIKSKINIKQLLQPKSLYIRLYILRGIRLTPKDSDGFCDPYLKISFGKTKISTRNRYIRDTLNPNFYESFEIPCKIPGTSTLSISVWDWDGIGDDLVGRTNIDIEDRWFSKSWQKIKKDGGRIPLEIRTLHNKSSSFSQGKLEIWIEILTDIEIKKQPILDISPPKPMPCELRVIIWECRDVTIKDQVTQMNDLYITGSVDGCFNNKKENKKLKKQQTDLHFRSQKGYGSFNWRMKYQLNLPTIKPPRFRIQIWDKDYFSVNDSICETYLSLSGLFKLCLKKSDRVIMKYYGKEKFWINDLRHANFDGNQGKIKISIECMPLSIAQQLPAGYGRSEPNMNPYLPEPNGRAKFSIFSPFRSLRNLLGDRVFYKLCIGFLLSALTSFIILIGPTLASTLMAKAMTGIN